MATVTAGTPLGSATDAITYTTAANTVAVGDLLCVWCGITGNTATDWVLTDSAGGTYTKIGRALKAASADFLELWVRTTLVASASAP
jgi:pectin methylesterase-like acyl-CoA thioesterase